MRAEKITADADGVGGILVKEKTSVVSILSIVDGFFFFAKTTGTSSNIPSTTAGAIPEASIVQILLISTSLKRFTNSTLIARSKVGSI